MATIKPKNNKRCRIQFKMSNELHDAHKTLQAQARKLDLKIDFADVFEKWFWEQLKQVKDQLETFEPNP